MDGPSVCVRSVDLGDVEGDLLSRSSRAADSTTMEKDFSQCYSATDSCEASEHSLSASSRNYIAGVCGEPVC